MSIKTITQPTFVGVTAAIIASAVFFTKINFNTPQQTIVEVQSK